MSESDRCPECRMCGGFHEWSCQSVPEEQKAAHFERYARTFLNGQERYREAMQQRNAVITALQGKCAVLKNENNKLRAKRRRLRRLLEMAEDVGYARREWVEAEEKWQSRLKHPHYRDEADSEKAYYKEKRADLYAAAGIPETEEITPGGENKQAKSLAAGGES